MCRKRSISLLVLIGIIAAVCIAGVPVYAQEKSDQTEVEALKARLQALQAEQNLKLKELEALITEIKQKIEAKEQEDELKKLLEEASQLQTVERKEDTSIGKRFHSGVRQQQGLNPNISVSGDFFGGISSSKDKFVTDPGDFSYGNNGFYLRELQVNLVAPLDPFTRGKTFISFLENEIVIEEAYMEWLNLPANMNLKMGIFNTEYGMLNRYHDHALPQFDRPRVLVDMFGNAPVGGFGLAGNFMLRPMFFSHASSLDLSVIQGGSGYSFTNDGKDRLLYVGNMTNFYDISENTFFEWRLSGVAGKNDPTEQYWSTVGNFSFEIKWVPVGRTKYRTMDWKTEILFSRREVPGDNIFSKGFYTSLQNKFNARWWGSARVGYSELPYDNDQHEWDFTVNADFWQSEFVFVRFQYQYNKRDLNNVLSYPGTYPDDNSFIFHVCWAMGPHKHEAY